MYDLQKEPKYWVGFFGVDGGVYLHDTKRLILHLLAQWASISSFGIKVARPTGHQSGSLGIKISNLVSE